MARRGLRLKTAQVFVYTATKTWGHREVILSDKHIREAQRNHGIVTPFVDKHVQPASIDLTLGEELLYRRLGCPDKGRNGYCTAGTSHFEFGHEQWVTQTFETGVYEGNRIEPDQFMLATTVETVSIPNNLVGQINGRSSWARKGLLVHTTAGYIDPGFTGTVTLELKNVGHEAIELKPGVRICQLVLTTLSSAAEFPYGHKELGSSYQGQTGVTESAL